MFCLPAQAVVEGLGGIHSFLNALGDLPQAGVCALHGSVLNPHLQHKSDVALGNRAYCHNLPRTAELQPETRMRPQS
jgi:hypothetical protein